MDAGGKKLGEGQQKKYPGEAPSAGIDVRFLVSQKGEECIRLRRMLGVREAER